MGNGLIALLVALGGSTWIYSKMMKSTGGQTKPALIVSGVAAFFIFIIVLLVARLIPS